MALTPEQIAGLRDACEELAGPINEWLLRDAARRIAQAGKMTSTAAYELYRANALGESESALKGYLRRQLGLSREEIRRLFRQAARMSARDDHERLGMMEAGSFVDGGLEQMAAAAVELAGKDLTNLTRTLGMVDRFGKAQPLQRFYRQTMDFAFEQVFTGAADYETAMRQATAHMADRGVRVIDYESGRHTGIEAAVRRNMMGGLGLMDEQITQADHDELGCDGWEISAHANSAPDHEDIQGRQYSDAAYKALNESLTRRIGTLNCGHVALPVLLGVNSPQYNEGQLRAFKEDNARGVSYEGRHYTGYEATQKQRQLERAQRVQKNRALVAKATGDEERLQTAQIRLGMLRGQYKQFSAAAGLPTREERIWVAGFQRNMNGERGKKQKTRRFTAPTKPAILRITQMQAGGDLDVKFVCDLNPEIYCVVSPEIPTKHVIITSKQLEHIKERHPDISEMVLQQLSVAVQDPDYIIETDKPATANILKRFNINGKGYQVVLRMRTEADPEAFQNSIITFMSVSEKRWRQYLRNRQILYKKE